MMRRRVLLGLVAAVCTQTAAAALAAPPTPAVTDRGAHGSGGAARAMAAEPAVRRSVHGDVKAVNESRGTVTLHTADGNLQLRLPPSAVRGIKKGDRLTVQLVVTTTGASAANATAPTPAKAEGTTKPFAAPKAN